MATKPQIVYFGSPTFAATILENLISNKHYEVVGVVTQPDTLQGRKQILTPSPVAIVADKYDLPIFKPEKLDDANLAHLRILKPDLFLVAAYGKIIPDSWLTTPTIKTLNLHFSLLPKYRGALCVSEPLKNGDSVTGVTLMEMTHKLDQGPIISQTSVDIDLHDNVASLTDKLVDAAKLLLDETLPLYLAKEILAAPQDESQATFTASHKTRTRANAYLDWNQLKLALNGIDAVQIHNLIRSLNPEPGAWTKINDKEIKILKTSITGDSLVLETVQPAGKNPLSWRTFSHNL